MPIVLLLVGAVFLIAAIRDRQAELGNLLVRQFSGPGSFTAWAFAFIMLALIGTVEALRPLSRALMILLLAVMILVNSREQNLITLLQLQLLGRGVGSAVATEATR